MQHCIYLVEKSFQPGGPWPYAQPDPREAVPLSMNRLEGETGAVAGALICDA